MQQRGVRGATSIPSDTRQNILQATGELLEAIFACNPDLKTEDISSAIFTVTEDIGSAYPAEAARRMGWEQVPMLCAREIPVTGGLPLCIRVLILWNTAKTQRQIQHVYLRDAAQLRPDLMKSIQEQLS